MKKKSLLLISLLAVMASCSKEETPIVEEPETVIETETKTELFSLVANSNEDEASSTKTSIGENNTILWQEGDALSVLANASEEENAKFTLKSGAGATSATFEGPKPVTDEDPNVYACYPYNEGNALFSYGDNHGVDFIWNGATQTATPGSFDPAKAPLYGCFENTAEALSNVTLKQVMAFVKITTDQRCKSIELKSNNENVPLACESFWLVNDEDGNPSIISFDGTSTSISLTGKDGAIIDPGTYYIAVLPQAYTGGLTISFVSADDTPYTHEKSNSTSITLQRKKITNFGKFILPVKEFNYLGGGTEERPYQISEVRDLDLLATLFKLDDFKYAHYALTDDIDCEGEQLVIIGGNDVNYFSGHIDGQNHTISNYLFGEGTRCAGLFGYVKGASFKNLKLDIGQNYTKVPEYAQDYFSQGFSVSPLVAYVMYSDNNTLITNCSVSGKINWNFKAWRFYYGDLVGQSNGAVQIEKSTSTADVALTSDNFTSDSNDYDIAFGGFIGKITPHDNDDKDIFAILDRCRNTGKIDVKSYQDSYVGGLIGEVNDDGSVGGEDVITRITNCVNSGYISGNKEYASAEDTFVGGFIGWHDSNGTTTITPYVYNCLNTGDVYSAEYAGGIIGYNYESTVNSINISNCVNTADILTSKTPEYDYTGAIVGRFGTSWMDYCYSTGCRHRYNYDPYPVGSEGAKPYSGSDEISAETMNGLKSEISASVEGFTYCDWTGKSIRDGENTLDLVF